MLVESTNTTNFVRDSYFWKKLENQKFMVPIVIYVTWNTFVRCVKNLQVKAYFMIRTITLFLGKTQYEKDGWISLMMYGK